MGFVGAEGSAAQPVNVTPPGPPVADSRAPNGEAEGTVTCLQPIRVLTPYPTLIP
jgi:hypothetical protein